MGHLHLLNVMQIGGFPGNPVAKNSMLPTEGAWV